MTFSGRGSRAGVKQGELWTDSIIVGGSDPLQSATGFIQASGTQLIFSGTNIYVGGSAMALGYQVPVASIGSPVSKEQVLIQAGSGATGAGSTVWLTFPTAFTKVPSVSVTSAKQAANEDYTFTTGNIGVGSIQIWSLGAASQDFYWIAVGGL
ncbi:MAG: hypothetical protein ACTSPB_23745 [Candidatus Thorarchaeota archaeon]